VKLDKIGLLGQMHHAGGTRQSRDNVGRLCTSSFSSSFYAMRSTEMIHQVLAQIRQRILRFGLPFPSCREQRGTLVPQMHSFYALFPPYGGSEQSTFGKVRHYFPSQCLCFFSEATPRGLELVSLQRWQRVMLSVSLCLRGQARRLQRSEGPDSRARTPQGVAESRVKPRHLLTESSSPVHA